MGKIWIKAPDITRQCCPCEIKNDVCSVCCSGVSMDYDYILKNPSNRPDIQKFMVFPECKFIAFDTDIITYDNNSINLFSDSRSDPEDAYREIDFALSLTSGTILNITFPATEEYEPYPGVLNAITQTISQQSSVDNFVAFNIDPIFPTGWGKIIDTNVNPDFFLNKIIENSLSMSPSDTNLTIYAGPYDESPSVPTIFCRPFGILLPFVNASCCSDLSPTYLDVVGSTDSNQACDGQTICYTWNGAWNTSSNTFDTDRPNCVESVNEEIDNVQDTLANGNNVVCVKETYVVPPPPGFAGTPGQTVCFDYTPTYLIRYTNDWPFEAPAPISIDPYVQIEILKTTCVNMYVGVGFTGLFTFYQNLGMIERADFQKTSNIDVESSKNLNILPIFLYTGNQGQINPSIKNRISCPVNLP